MFKNLNIGLRFFIGFGLIFLLFIALTLFGINRMDFLSDQTTMMYNHPLTVSNAVLRVNANIIKVHRAMKDVVLARDLAGIEEASEIVDGYESEAYKDFEIIGERFLGENSLYEDPKTVFIEWKSIRDEVIVLMREGKRVEAAEITKGKGARHVLRIENAMEALDEFSRGKALEFLDKIKAARDEAFKTMYLLVFVVVIFGVVFAAFLTRSVTRPVQVLQDAAVEIGKGRLDTKIEIESRDEVGRLARAFGEMTANLKNITASRDELNKEMAGRKSAEEELRRLNEALEERVGERTRDLEMAQERLVRSEKLAAIGQLASSVGHELRNPLGVIANSAYFLGMKLKGADKKVLKHIGLLNNEVRRSNKIISDLLDFSRVKNPDLIKGDLNRVIKETLSDIGKKEKITVETRLDDSLPEFFFDPDQIRQVILNIVSNAVHAMPDGGLVEIRTKAGDEQVEMIFRDTGVGIPGEDLQRIYEPLYSTKAQGTGLGLAIAKGFIDSHKGAIGVESKVGEGTTFTVSLPLEPGEV